MLHRTAIFLMRLGTAQVMAYSSICGRIKASRQLILLLLLVHTRCRHLSLKKRTAFLLVVGCDTIPILSQDESKANVLTSSQEARTQRHQSGTTSISLRPKMAKHHTASNQTSTFLTQQLKQVRLSAISHRARVSRT